MSDHHLNNNSSQGKPQNGNQLSSQPIQTIQSPPSSDALVLYSPPQGISGALVPHSSLQESATTPNTPSIKFSTASTSTVKDATLTTGVSSKVYPPPIVKHVEVVANGSLFLDTLHKFHATLGTKFMVPTIGGKELDLHHLYVEVTSRGGLKQVIRERKWKEITAVFNFPPTATNASYILRKYYISLLHHYEQVYFFQAQGPLILPPPATLPAPNPVLDSPVIDDSANSPKDEVQPLFRKRKRKVSMPVSGADPISSVGRPVTGVIDGKFEHGYLVTVVVGLERLRGVLYQVPTGFSGEQFAEVPGYVNNPNLGDTSAGARPRRRRRRKDEIKKRDPDHPKPNRSGYNFFFAEQHTRLKALHPGKDREISKMIGDSWNKLSEEAKAVYQELGLKDKERYKTEMQEYRQRQQSHSQDTGFSLAINEGTTKQLEDQHSLQFQHQGASICTKEGLHQQLEKHSNLLEHRPEHFSGHTITKNDGLKITEVSDTDAAINIIMPKKQDSLVVSTFSTNQEEENQQQSVDTVMFIKEENSIQESKCKHTASER